MTAIKKETVDRIIEGMGDKGCPDCGGHEFNVHDQLQFVGQIHLDPSGNRIDMANGQGFVVMTCGNCGLAKFYNAKILGY